MTIKEIAIVTGFNYGALRRRIANRVRDGLTHKQAVREVERHIDLRIVRARERKPYVPPAPLFKDWKPTC